MSLDGIFNRALSVFSVDAFVSPSLYSDVSFCASRQDEHPLVAETAAVGYPHDIKGEGKLTVSYPHDIKGEGNNNNNNNNRRNGSF